MSRSDRGAGRGWVTVIGALAAMALAARGILDWNRGGWALLLVAMALIAALLLRRFVYRD